jgi:hypothetical protein
MSRQRMALSFVFGMTWVLLASYLSHVIVFGSLSPDVRWTIARTVIMFLGFTGTILGQALWARSHAGHGPAK